MDDDPQQAQRLDVSRVPLCVTVSQVGGGSSRRAHWRAATDCSPVRAFCCLPTPNTCAPECVVGDTFFCTLARSPLQIGAHSVVDLTAQEELCSSASVQVAVDAAGAVCGLTKRRQKGVDPSVALVSALGPAQLHEGLSMVECMGAADGQAGQAVFRHSSRAGSTSRCAHLMDVGAAFRTFAATPPAGNGGGGAAGGRKVPWPSVAV